MEDLCQDEYGSVPLLVHFLIDFYFRTCMVMVNLENTRD